MRPAKILFSLGIRPVWSESSLSAWRKLGSLATHWAHSEDSDQIGRMPRLIWVFAGRTCHFVGFVMRWLIFQMGVKWDDFLFAFLHIRSLRKSNLLENGNYLTLFPWFNFVVPIMYQQHIRRTTSALRDSWVWIYGCLLILLVLNNFNFCDFLHIYIYKFKVFQSDITKTCLYSFYPLKPSFIQ